MSSGWDGFLDWLGYSICHQLPERTIHFGNGALFVCARDTGLYVGFFLVLMAIALPWRRRQGGFPSRPWQACMLLAFLYFSIDAVSSTLGWRESNNVIRFTSGLLMGSAAALLVCPLVNRLAWRAPREERVLGSRTQPYLLVLVLAGACAVFLSHPAWLFRPAQVLLFLCFAGTLCYLNFALFASLWSASSRSLSPRVQACLLAAAPLLAAAELSLAHWLHTTLGSGL
jgi:uncharacterized membrane protein